MVKILKKSPVNLVVFLLCIPFFSYSEIPQGDTPYLQSLVTDKLELIISESYRKESHFIHKYSRQFYKEYKTLFADSPAFKNFLVFISPRKQLLNGSATVSPLPLMHIYSNASYVIDQVATHNWLHDSLAHEMAHLYQLNSQEKVSSWLRFFLPANSGLTYPNMSLHALILEGNAVLMESLYGTGGRLFSGWVRAFVFSQIKNQVPLKRIFNNYSDTFSLKEKYLHGGYFFAYLLKNHSLKKINQLFSRRKNRIFSLVGMQTLNQIFYKTFSESFPSLFKKYQEFYLPEALNQKNSSASSLFTSATSAPLNSDQEHLYFLISDGKSPPWLVTLNKKTLSFSRERKDMPMGKVFLIEDSFYSTGKGHTDTLVSETSLFREGYISLKKYNSRYVMDIKGNKTISFDTSKGPLGWPLYVNNSFYDFIQSTAIMDEEGNIYYFKQHKNIRTLYQNQTPIWSFKGYYSFPVEADKDGVYFIGPTKYGSGLFVYKKDRVFRLSNSDTIVSGRKINSSQFLVSELGPYDYSYKIISPNKTNETPWLYKYNFEKPHDFQVLLKKLQDRAAYNLKTNQTELGLLNENPMGILRATDSKGRLKTQSPTDIGNFKTKKREEENLSDSTTQLKKTALSLQKPLTALNSKTDAPSTIYPFHYYRSLTNLKFRYLLFIPLLHSTPPFVEGVYFQLNFIDPLQSNRFSVSGLVKNGKKAGEIKYVYKRYRPLIELKYQFENDPLIQIQSKTGKFINNIRILESKKLSELIEELLIQKQILQFSSYKMSLFHLALQYPIIKTENWSISFKSLVGLGKESFTLSQIRMPKNKNERLSQIEPHESKATNERHSSLFFNHKSKLQFDYDKKYPYAFGRHKNLNLGIYYDSLYQKNRKKLYLALGGLFAFEKELKKEWYLSGSGKWERNMKGLFSTRPFANNEKNSVWSFHSFITREKFRIYQQADLAIKKVLNQSLYSLYLPVSLKRWAPLMGASLISFSENPDTSDHYFINMFFGGELELSFNHRLDAFAGFSLGLIQEFENFKRKRNHGFHKGVYFKTIF